MRKNESSKFRDLNNKDLTLLTLQTTEEYGFANFKRYRENKEYILNEILSEFLDIFKIDDSEVIHKNVHGWLYAYSENQSSEVFGMIKNTLALLVIGLQVEELKMLGLMRNYYLKK